MQKIKNFLWSAKEWVKVMFWRAVKRMTPKGRGMSANVLHAALFFSIILYVGIRNIPFDDRGVYWVIADLLCTVLLSVSIAYIAKSLDIANKRSKLAMDTIIELLDIIDRHGKEEEKAKDPAAPTANGMVGMSGPEASA